MAKTEVTVEVIIHATENIDKIFDAVFELFGIEKKEFDVQELSGHFDNPITLIRARLAKKKADHIIKKLFSGLPENQVHGIMDSLDERIQNSTLHLRLDKQEFVKGNLTLQENDAVKVKIYTPVYQKKETINTYAALLRSTM